MFENFDDDHLKLIYQGLKALIESGKGDGFYNKDMRSLVYMSGSQGGKLIEEELDSPEKNVLFQMLSEMTKELQKREIGPRFIWFYDFSNWQKFCQFAVVCGKKRYKDNE